MGASPVGTGLRVCGLQELWFPGCRARASWHTGLVAPRHVGSSWTRDRTRVSCIGRRTLTAPLGAVFICISPVNKEVELLASFSGKGLWTLELTYSGTQKLWLW